MEDRQDESGLPDPTDVDWDAELTEAILGCLAQGVSIGLGAVPDNDQVEEPR